MYDKYGDRCMMWGQGRFVSYQDSLYVLKESIIFLIFNELVNLRV